jgi:hypothetical protein
MTDSQSASLCVRHPFGTSDQLFFLLLRLLLLFSLIIFSHLRVSGQVQGFRLTLNLT